MSLFKKKSKDPYNLRIRQLNEQIAELENRIKQLKNQAEKDVSQGSTCFTSSKDAVNKKNTTQEPVFEQIDNSPLTPLEQRQSNPSELYNELGIRKYDLYSAIKRFMNKFRKTDNVPTRFVNHLLVGNLDGLRPLRYERRVARNRFILLVVCLFIILWGLLSVYLKNR